MSATVTRLDDHRPSLLARARSAMRAWWNGLHLTDLPYVPPMPLSLYVEVSVARRQKPLNWPLCKGDTFDEYLIDLARHRGLTLRTRDGHRVRLDRPIDDNVFPGEMPGRLELADGCDGALEWHALWMEDGSFAVHEHKWDLVSVETASCIHCDKHDVDMDFDMAWDFVTVDRERGLGVCSRCAGGEAA